MGLDIYVYKSADIGKYCQAQEDIKEIVQKSKSRTVIRKTAFTKKKAYEKGLGAVSNENGFIGLYNPWCELVRMSSRIYPFHEFQIGHFRSSYNDSSLNSILKMEFNTSLEDIFDYKTPSEDVFLPNWRLVKRRVRKFIKKLNPVHMYAKEALAIIEETCNYVLNDSNYVYFLRWER